MILLLESDRGFRADTLREMLYFIGILSKKASSIKDIRIPLSAISAVILLDAPQDAELAKARRLFDGKIFRLCDADDKIPVLESGALASEMVSNVRDLEIASGTKPVGTYIIGELDASVWRDGVYFHNERISFTKTETMILRSLIALYPCAVGQGELLNLAFRESRAPDVSNIRTHICVMNKKLLAHAQKRLITSSAASEYSLNL